MERLEQRRVFVFETREDVFGFVLRKWRDLSSREIDRNGRFVVALSGGKTPTGLYQRLADAPRALPWEKTHIFLVDERHVPLDDPESNYAMIKRNLLTRIVVPSENVHPVPICRTPELSARKYEEGLRDFFQLSKGDFPSFDLILLGIGEDGHTASLFRNAPALAETQRLAVPVRLTEPKRDRISLSLLVINRAKRIVFLVTGKNKATIVKKIIGRSASGLPASLVRPARGETLFLLDKAAGSLLPEDRINRRFQPRLQT
jgi:6-phosphogluconolactonase